MIVTYGITTNGTHTDTSKTLRDSKLYATLNGFDQVSKRTGYNAHIVARKFRGKWINAVRSLKNVAIYDNGGKTMDSISICFLDSQDYDVFDFKDTVCECLSSSHDGVSFFQHTNCIVGPHLGKKIKFNDLDQELKNKLTNYFKS